MSKLDIEKSDLYPHLVRQNIEISKDNVVIFLVFKQFNRLCR